VKKYVIKEFISTCNLDIVGAHSFMIVAA